MNIDHSTWNAAHILYHAAVWLVTALVLSGLLFLTVKFAVRGYRFKGDEMKAANLNRRQRRKLRAAGKNKKSGKKPF